MILRSNTSFLFLALMFLVFSCKEESKAPVEVTEIPEETPIFRLLDASQTNVTFMNTVTEDKNVNYVKYESIYNGSGVAIGDINNDGLADTVLDAELASLLAFRDDLEMRGVSANLSVIIFESTSAILDMDPTTTAVDLTTTPTTDVNGNGVPDFEDVVRGIQISGGTAFEPALQNALQVFTTLNSGPDGTLVFLSDGSPFDIGAYDD